MLITSSSLLYFKYFVGQSNMLTVCGAQHVDVFWRTLFYHPGKRRSWDWTWAVSMLKFIILIQSSGTVVSKEGQTQELTKHNRFQKYIHQKYGQLVFDKGAKWQDSFSINGVVLLDILRPGKKKSLDLNLMPCIKTNSEWILDLHINS